MATHVPGSVPLAELAKHLKTIVALLEDECRALYVFVGVDWAGRPAVADAYGLASGKLREQREHEAAWGAYQLEAENWQRARAEVVSVAEGHAYRAAVLSEKGNSKAQQLGLEAGREAGRQWEEEHPPPEWQGTQPDRQARRRYTSDSMFRRALDRVVGGAA